jgi:hypothetical protein
VSERVERRIGDRADAGERVIAVCVVLAIVSSRT